MQLGVDICGRGYSQIDRIGADDPQLVRQLDVGGVGDGDLETALLDPVRKRGIRVKTCSGIASAASEWTCSVRRSISGRR
jgi:hypothetical protein